MDAPTDNDVKSDCEMMRDEKYQASNFSTDSGGDLSFFFDMPEIVDSSESSTFADSSGDEAMQMLDFIPPSPGQPFSFSMIEEQMHDTKQETKYAPQHSLHARRKSRRSAPYLEQKKRAPASASTCDKKADVTLMPGRKKDTMQYYRGLCQLVMRRDRDNTFRLRDRRQKVARRPRYLYVKVDTEKARETKFAFDLYGTTSEDSPNTLPLPDSVNLPAKMIKCRSSANSAVFRVDVTNAILPSHYSRQGTHFFVINVRLAGQSKKMTSTRFSCVWHVQK